MSAPDKIWTSGGHYWEDPTFKRDKTEYTRSDMIPTAAYVAGLEAAAKRALEESVADDMDTWFEGLRAALSARPDAPSCRVCGKGGLSTIEDGGPECQLHDETWVCSSECYIIARPDAADIYIKRVSLADLEGYGSTTQPADTRVVTVAQLDRWLGCLVSLEIKDEIHTIIGDVK